MTVFLYYLRLDAELEKRRWGRGGRGRRWREHSGGLTPTLDANVDSRDFHHVGRRLVVLQQASTGGR